MGVLEDIIGKFGVKNRKSGVSSVFATHSLRQAACDGVMRLSHLRYMAKRKGEALPTGCGMTSYNTTQIGKQVQVDLF